MQSLRELTKWGLKSTAALGANLALLTIWVDHAGIPPELAVLINIPLITSVAYIVTDKWVFSRHESPSGLRGHVRQYVGMQAVNMSGKLVNYLLYVILLRYIDYRLAWVVGAITVFLYTFAGNQRWWARITTADPDYK